MLLFSSAKPEITFTTLDQVENPEFDQYLELVTKWFTEEWGYLHDKDKSLEEAINDRTQYLYENSDKIYVALYDKQLVGAFRFENKEFDEQLTATAPKTNEIWFLYVEPSMRNLGIASKIVDHIKQLSTNSYKEVLLQETLKPSLNRLYELAGAEIISEHHLDLNPTDVLSINLQR